MKGALLGEHREVELIEHGDWLPNDADETYIKSLMHPVYEPGKMASWIAPPGKGINGLPNDFVYVRL